MELSPAEPDVRRHKRTFAMMAHQVSFSPSPVPLRDRVPSDFSIGSVYSRAPSTDNSRFRAPLLERRRLSHPHNHSISFPRRTEDMAQPHRPRLVHRTSQTVIDLTDEPEIQIVAARHRGEDFGQLQVPPRLGRSDAEGLENVIDLTEDSDLIITGGRQIPLPRPPSQPVRNREPRQRVLHSPPLFVPQLDNSQRRAPHAVRLFPMDQAVEDAFRANFPPHHMIIQHLDGDFPNMDLQGMLQEPPDALNYVHHAFEAPKPAHVPPKPARDHFTRSPREDDIVICPSCERELVHRKEQREGPLKKSGKVMSKKDREEHPFWVVKECGHVYCNNCFQNRSSRSHKDVTFPEIGPPGKKTKASIKCAVEDCEAEVKEKSKWVGVFL